MVRIAHLADTHLGYKQYNLEERENDIYNTLDEIGNKILEEHADILVHSGDLFDTSRPSPQSYRAFKNFLTKLDGKIKIFAILGDHDRPKLRGIAPQLLFDDKLQILGRHGHVEIQEVKVDGKDIVIAGLSNLSKTYRSVLTEELRSVGSRQLDSKISVLLLHEGIDKFLPFEGAFELYLDEVPKNFSYVAMGHVHQKIKAACGGGILAYPGSSEIISRNEIGGWQKNGKGFNIVDIDNDDVQVTAINLECIRPQVEAKLRYACLDEDVSALVKSLSNLNNKPIVHATVEGKNVDRQSAHQTLNSALSGITLNCRPDFVEESETRLPELKSGSFNVSQVISEYFKDEKVAGLSLELWKALKAGDLDEAQRIAGEYFTEELKNDSQ